MKRMTRRTAPVSSPWHVIELMLTMTSIGVLELDTSSFELEMPSENTFDATDAWSIRDRKERIKLYKYWLHRYRKYEVEAYLEELCADYEKLCSEKKVLDEELQVQVLNEAAVIGMTTTGVAKFQRLIHAVQPEIVIVEEAAEVLEAHIVTALSAATKHVILIGDHQQLRPGTCKYLYFLFWKTDLVTNNFIAEYTLAMKYHLDVSLFERMVLNGMEHMTLLRQRRMRPAISNLLVPIYPNLYNHPDVERYPNVKGVSSNLFFVDHQVEETQVRKSILFPFLVKFQKSSELFVFTTINILEIKAPNFSVFHCVW